jgi:hypothetical protein
MPEKPFSSSDVCSFYFSPLPSNPGWWLWKVLISAWFAFPAGA